MVGVFSCLQALLVTYLMFKSVLDLLLGFVHCVDAVDNGMSLAMSLKVSIQDLDPPFPLLLFGNAEAIALVAASKSLSFRFLLNLMKDNE